MKYTNDKCNSCMSPQPHLHPSVQEGGEVRLCSDEFHDMITTQNTTERVQSVKRLLAVKP